MGQRKESDFYETPFSMTKQLIEREVFHRDRLIFDPCCGNGAIIDVLLKNKYCADGKDLKQGYDFLKDQTVHCYIITNPPYSLANKFIKHCQKIVAKKFALLLPLSYLHGQQRYEEKLFILEEFPLSKIYVFTRYPMLGEPLRKDGKYNTGMVAYAWYIWERDTIKNPEIHWIDNNEFVLRLEK